MAIFQHILNMIETAHKSIVIESPYLLGDTLESRLRQAAERGWTCFGNDISNVSFDALYDVVHRANLHRGFLHEAPFTVAGKIKCVGNGVPMAMGRAFAQAAKRAMVV